MLFKMGDKNDEARLRAYALKNGAFDSKKAAFDYLFIYEGKSVEEAERLAEMIASARGVPEVPEPPKSFVDKIKDLISQGSSMAKENPKGAEFVYGLVSGALTTAFGVKVGSDISSSEAPKHEIDDSQEIKELD